MGTEFSDNLKLARLTAGKSQKDVAETIGVAKSTYSLYESGNREPGVPIIKKIARCLNVSADALLGIDTPVDAAPSGLSSDEEIIIKYLRDDESVYTNTVLQLVKDLHSARKNRPVVRV